MRNEPCDSKKCSIIVLLPMYEKNVALLLSDKKSIQKMVSKIDMINITCLNYTLHGFWMPKATFGASSHNFVIIRVPSPL